MHRLPLAPAFARSARPRSGFVQCPLAVVGEGAWALTPPPLPGAWPFRLYLRRTAIDKQLDPSHETGIARRKKKCRRSDLMRLTDPTHRDDRHELVLHLLRNADEDVGVDRARADHIHANVPVFQVNRPGARESAHGCLARVIDAESREPYRAGD